MWNEYEQGIVLGAFFYGYVLTQIPGGRLAERFGAKWLYGVGVLATALLTLLTPLAAKWSIYAFVVLRVLMGLGEVCFSCLLFELYQFSTQSCGAKFVLQEFSERMLGKGRLPWLQSLLPQAV